MRAKRLVEAALDLAWSVRPSTRSNRIIYYHSVHPSLPSAHRPNGFERQIEWLNSQGYRSTTMSEIPDLLKADPLPEPWIAITFDDGYRDNLEFAHPILLSHGFSATIYVVAGLVGKAAPIGSNHGHKLYESREMLTETDLAELSQSGIEIGSHSLHHKLASAEADRSYARFVGSLSESRAILQQATGQPVESFAYPNGQKGAFSDRTRRAAEETGFRTAATTMWGSVWQDSDPLTLPRCEMAADDSLDDFVAKMTGGRDYRWAYQRVLDRSRVW